MTREVDPLVQEANEFQALIDRAEALQRRAVNPVAARLHERFFGLIDAGDPDAAFDYLAKVLTDGRLPDEH